MEAAERITIHQTFLHNSCMNNSFKFRNTCDKLW